MTTTRKPVTSSEVARAAGVSRSAVSRAFTDGASISIKKRARVLEAATRLGYRPNEIARSLITRRSKMIGLVMANLDNPFYCNTLSVFSNKLQQKGLRVLLFAVDQAHEIDDALPSLLQYQVDGVIITSAIFTSSMAKTCFEIGIPVVLYNRYIDDFNNSSVSTDNAGGGRAIADHFVDQGYWDLAFISGTKDTSSSLDRQRGFQQQLHARGIPSPRIDSGDFCYEGGRDAARRLLTVDKPPRAIFCANDVMAMGAMDCVRAELGLRIPQDVAIAGFDGIAECARPSYDLTTIVQDVETMVERAIQLLRENTESSPPEPRRESLQGQLVVRSSTG